jgi:uncharacterized membrane protein
VYVYVAGVFVLLAVFFGVSHQVAAGVFVLAGLCSLIFGVRHQQFLLRVSGVLLLLFASVLTWFPWFHHLFFLYGVHHVVYGLHGSLVSIVILLGAAWLAKSEACTELERTMVSMLLGIVGVVGWLGFAVMYFDSSTYLLGYFALCAVLWGALAYCWRSAGLQILAFALTPMTLIYVSVCMLHHTPLTLEVFAIGAGAFVVQYAVLYGVQKAELFKTLQPYWHGFATLLLLSCAQATLTRMQHVWHFSALWHVVGVGMIFVLALGVIALGARATIWPFTVWKYLYTKILSAVLIVSLYFYGLATSLTLQILPQHFFYLPVLNPQDIMMLLSGVALVWWAKSHIAWLQKMSAQIGSWIGGAMLVWILAWSSAMVLRAVHVWMHVPYSAYALYHSTVAQTSISIVWAVLGLALVWVASRRALKPLWMMGALVLVLVVLKLFFVDLSHVNTIARIVSFIGVGGVLLLIGYVSPLKKS